MSKANADDQTGQPSHGRKAERDVGSQLKKAYDQTLREDIPQDLLDLLGKLD